MNKQWNRLISVLLAFVMVFGMLIEVLPAASAETISDQETAAPAASADPAPVPAGENLISDGGFEGSVALVKTTAAAHEAGKWYDWQLTGIQQGKGRNGSAAVTLGVNKDTAAEQDVTGLRTGATYRFSAWVKVEPGFSSGNQIEIGIKDVDNNKNLKIVHPATDTAEWQQITFDYTYHLTGNLRVFAYTAGSNVQVHVDDVELRELVSEQQNLLVDGGFETKDPTVNKDKNSVNVWYDNAWGYGGESAADSWQAADAQSGSHCVKLTAQGSKSSGGVNFKLDTLEVGATYRFTMWAKQLSDTGTVYVGAKGYEGTNEQKAPVSGNEWKPYSVEFVYKEGTPEVYVYTDGNCEALVDSASLVKIADPVNPEPPVQEALVKDGSFESGELLNWTHNFQTGKWYKSWKNRTTVENAARTGGKAAMLHGATASGSDSKDADALQQNVAASGLKTGRTYRFTLWAKASKADAGSIYMQVKFDGSKNYELKMENLSTEWQEYTIQFRYDSKNDVQLILWNDTFHGDVYVDDVALTEVEENVKAQLESITAANGRITAVLDQDPTFAPLADEFALSAKIDGTARTVAVRGYHYDPETHTAVFDVAPFAEKPDGEQNVEISVTYREVTKTASFQIEKHTAATYYVTAGETVPEGGQKVASIDELNKLVFGPGDKILFHKGETFLGTFKPQGSGAEGYPIVIDSYGEGARPVLTPRAEDNFEGNLQKGIGGGHRSKKVMWRSGIHFYNVEWWEVRNLELNDRDYYDAQWGIGSADEHKTRRFDPDVNSNDWTGAAAFAAGIRVINKNAGDLHHFVFDNLYIHHFRGPSINEGKSSGGIHFNTLVECPLGDTKGDGVNTIKNDPRNIPSAINEIRITNCEISYCGRSGVNFLTPWQYRAGVRQGDPDFWKDGRENDNWSTSVPGNAVGEGALQYHPYTNFYFANNTVHHIDGDGLIVDTVRYAVVEKNLVYETAIHLGLMHAAVGMFNWTADDNYYQYNEIFNVGKDATGYGNPPGAYRPKWVPGDAQGIEIDGLNDRTWIQYNYVHDNVGGFMMYCNLAGGGVGYPAFNGVIRYNISQNDHMKNNSIFHTFPWTYHSETYNNVIYLSKDLAAKGDTVPLLHNADSADANKMYNNIFYLDQPGRANTFGTSDKFDWQSNIFYNFEKAPVSTNPSAPNVTANPGFVAPGTAGNGTAAPTVESLREMLKGYKIRTENNEEGINAVLDMGVRLPSMQMGIPVLEGQTDAEFFGGLDNWAHEKTNFKPMTDFFGNPVDEFPDIGVHEVGAELSGMKPVWLDSTVHAVDQAAHTVTVEGSIPVAQLKTQLFCARSAAFEIRSGAEAASDDHYAVTGDQIVVTNGEKSAVYTLTVNPKPIEQKGDIHQIVPRTEVTAQTGSWEHNNPTEGDPNYAIDGNDSTIWHSDYNGNDRASLWISLSQKEAGKYNITGFLYTPRPGKANFNGRITKYNLLGRIGDTWTTLVEGGKLINEDDNTKPQIIEIPAELYNAYDEVKLVAVESVSQVTGRQFAASGELRLLSDNVTRRPAAPEFTVEKNGETVMLRWNAAPNAVSYLLMDQLGNVVYQGKETSFDASALDASGSYQLFAVYADGTLSDAAAVLLQEPAAELLGHNITLKDRIAVNFSVKLNAEHVSGASMRFTLPNGGKVLEIAAADAKQNPDGAYIFTCPMVAKEMTDLIRAEMIVDGKVVFTDEYSVEEYAKIILTSDKPEFADAKEIVRSMLNYGAAAQSFFGYHTDRLANRSLTAEQKTVKATAEKFSGFASGKPAGVTGLDFAGAELNLVSAVGLRHYFKLSEGQVPENFRFEVTRNGKTVILTPVKSGEMYYVEIEAIYANNLSNVFTLKVTNTQDQTTSEVVYGPYHYANTVMRGSNELKQALMLAMADYTDAASAYIAGQKN